MITDVPSFIPCDYLVNINQACAIFAQIYEMSGL